MLKDFLKVRNDKAVVAKPERKTEGRAGKSLSEALVEAKGESNTNATRLANAEVDVSSLIAASLLQDKNISVTVYDGVATELVESYEMYKSLESKRDSEIEKLKKEVEVKEEELPYRIRELERNLKEDASKPVTEAQNTLEELKQDMMNKIAVQKEKLEKEIRETQENYQQAFDETLQEAEQGAQEIREIMKTLNIPAINVKTDVGSLPEIEDLLELAKADAELIKGIRETGGAMEEIKALAKVREDKIKASATLSASLLIAPVSLSYALVKVTKKFMDITLGKKYIKELTEEIQTCFKLAIQQINEFKLEYCLPDMEDLKKELSQVEFVTKEAYSKSLEDAEAAVSAAKRSQAEKLKDFDITVKREAQKMRTDLDNFKKESEELLNNLKQNCVTYKKEWDRQKALFEEGQVLPNFEDMTMHKLLNELCPSSFVKRDKYKDPTLIDKLRLYNEQEVLEGLDYSDAPENDSLECIGRYKYDQELREQLEKTKQVTSKLTANGETREYIEGELEDTRRALDKYYCPTFRNLLSGTHIHHPNVAEALDGAEELYLNNFDSTSFLFVYDKEKEGESDYLANYIKYQVQQILTGYHPDSIKVNIINPTLGFAFNNLQVSLDTVDKDGKLVKGREYCKTYNTQEEIERVFKDIQSSVNALLQGDLMRFSCEELVFERRKKGAVTPQFNINILYDVNPADTPFRVFDKSAKYIGVYNIYLVEKSKLLTYESEKKQYKLNEDMKPLIDDIGIIGERVQKGNNQYIYLTNKSTKQISRFLYKSRRKEDENKLGDVIRDKALGVKKPVVITEEFLNSIPSVKEKGYWAESGKSKVKLYFGYVDGDESKPYPVVLDEDDSVHMFIGGTTGGGKSNLLAVMINCLKMMYPPSELDIIYFDFKVTEVAIHAKPYKMPHCSAMSGTSAPDYLISLFQYCTDEMMRRYNLFKKWNTVKLSKLIDKMKARVKELRDQGEDKEADVLEASIPKRIVMVVDEAAQAFQLSDDNAVEKVKTTLIKIAQLARAAGMHMILVSQDPNRMPAEVLTLLKWRGCTKAGEEISKAILYESNIAARAENQFIGFFATTNNKGEEFNQRYVVPLNEEPVTMKFSKIAFDKAKKDINRDAVTFDENDPYTIESHEFYLNNVGKDNVYTGMNILLGEPVYFIKKFRPHEIRLKVAEQQNVAVITGDDNLRKDLFRTIMASLDGRADFLPVYCKAPPTFAPPKLFLDIAERDDTLENFMIFEGKFALTDEEREYILSKIDETSLEQFFPGEIRTRAEAEAADEEFEVVWDEYKRKLSDAEDSWKVSHPDEPFPGYLMDELGKKIDPPEPPEDIGWETSFMDVFPSYIQYRRKNKITKPLYVFMFGLERHKSVIDIEFDWKSFADMMNTANMTNVHLIYFGSDVERILDKNICNYIIAGKLAGDVMDSKFKNIELTYCKCADMLNNMNSALFKPIQYEVPGGD